MTKLEKAVRAVLAVHDKRQIVEYMDEMDALREALAEQPAQQEPVAKLWLWRNFVKGKPEYWAFDNPYPVNLDNDDPQTLGSPCGYALFKPSRDGSRGRTEDEVLLEIKGALNREHTRPQAREWVGLTDDEIHDIYDEVARREPYNMAVTRRNIARAIEAKLREKNA